jgi:perosamine synthetase
LIAHARPTLDESDAERVARTVRSGFVAQGHEVEAFEAELAPRFGTAAAAAVGSGTAALELALRALGIAPDDEVIIPSYVCDALYQAVARCGGVPVLADADPETASLSALDARRRLTARTRCAIVPHAFGLATDVRAFAALGVPIVEDCAQALGATIDGRPAGSAGAIAVASFYATKMLTTGEGGVVTGPAALVARVRDARQYDERDDLAPRANAKMTDMQAALGRGQLARLDGFIARRRAIADRYRAGLRGLPCRTPPAAGERHVYHRFIITVDGSVDAVQASLAARGVAARRPVFRPAHRALGRTGFPEADRLWAQSLSIPCYPALSDADVDAVIAALGRALAP